MRKNLYGVRVSSDKHSEYNVALGSSTRYAPAVGGGQYAKAPNVWVQIWIPKFGTERRQALLQNADLTSYQRRSIMNEDRSERYQIVIRPEAFTDLASHMMQADPEAAIKAFGTAMQAVPPIPKAKADSSSEEAA
jgi:hypothetical protein